MGFQYDVYFFSLRKKLYPFGSTDGYERDERNYGDRDWRGRKGLRSALLFWYGQTTHFITGCAPALLLGWLSPFLVPAFFLGYVFAKEWFFDRNNLGLERLESKEIIDIAAHVAGALCGNIPWYIVGSLF